jgi:hypothetical protein
MLPDKYSIETFIQNLASKFASVAITVISNMQKYNTEYLDNLSSISIPHFICPLLFNYY